MPFPGDYICLTVLRGERFQMDISYLLVAVSLATFKSFLTLTSQYLKEVFLFEILGPGSPFCLCGFFLWAYPLLRA